MARRARRARLDRDERRLSPAFLALGLAAGLATLGISLGRALEGRRELIDDAAWFLTGCGAVGSLVQLSLLRPGSLLGLRLTGFLIALVGAVLVARFLLEARKSGRLRSFLASCDRTELLVALVALLGFTALFASTLAPPTDADSLDYHLGAPKEWLRAGILSGRDDWFAFRFAGSGEGLNALGIAAGTDRLGAVLQLAGAALIVLAVRQLGETKRDRLFGIALALGCPVLVFLVPTQKPFILPVAATTIALLLIERRASPSVADAVKIFGCLGFAAGCKATFVISGGVLGTAFLLRNRGAFSPKIWAVSLSVFAALAAPPYVRNLRLYGDPISPFGERYRPGGDERLVRFADVLRNQGEPRNPRGLTRFAGEMIATFDLASASTTLGAGVLAFFVARGPRRGFFLASALALFALLLFFAPLSPRFFLEPYLWAGAAATVSPWGPRKAVLFGILAIQLALVTVGSSILAFRVLPAVFSARSRDEVLSRSAAGYAEAKWVDESLPPTSVLLLGLRFHSLFFARTWIGTDPIAYSPTRDVAYRSFTDLLDRGATHMALVLPEPLPKACASVSFVTKGFTVAKRNPWAWPSRFSLALVPVERTETFRQNAFACFFPYPFGQP